MRRYEVVFVLAPTLSEEEVKTNIETYSKAAEELGAAILNVDEWGKRRLAFPVKKFNDGIYVILTLEEEAAAAVAELERRFRVSDAVIRFLTVRIDENLKRAEKFKERREARKARRAAARVREKAAVAAGQQSADEESVSEVESGGEEE